MNQFVALYRKLDQTQSSNEKVKELQEYFSSAIEKDKLWALALLSGRRPKRTVNTSLLRIWAAELAEIPDWLFEESYHTVGDLAETIALLVDQQSESKSRPLYEWMEVLANLKTADEELKKTTITSAWLQMNSDQRFVFNKLITGGFRVGVSQKTVEKAISQYTGIDSAQIAHRLMGSWDANSITWQKLIIEESDNEDLSKPYPFCLAYPLQDEVESLGGASEWLAEWKWDGIRGQFISRGGEYYLWSRGEELITDRFPEFTKIGDSLPDGTVIDGEIVILKEGKILSFQHLQTRIGRKKPGKKILNDSPAGFIAYDLLEYQGEDLRQKPLIERRELLKKIVEQHPSEIIKFSDSISFQTWEDLAKTRQFSRENDAEGLMLKHVNSEYKVGRKRGDWWKWKVDPMTIDAVMIYAMPGHGRRANLFTDYTLAVWKDDLLVPVAKAYSGLTDDEIREVDAFVKANTVDKFGPVRSVKAELVFEIGFENIQYSSRHKSGIALRFPRIIRWRKDKPAAEADHLANLIALLEK
ncbi:MAG: ATP-dependent DNA ligase [Bacteroidia bacterium]